MFFGSNLPKGVGRNGIVFETKRPDDPEKFSLRFQDKIKERQKTIDEDFHQKKLEETDINEELKRKEQLLQQLSNEVQEVKKVNSEMSEDLNEMSQYQIYQKYAYLTMEDIKEGLSNLEKSSNVYFNKKLGAN